MQRGAEHLLRKAEEIRAIGEAMNDPVARFTLIGLAARYVELASKAQPTEGEAPLSI